MDSVNDIIRKLSPNTMNRAMEIAHMGCWEWNIQDGSEVWSDEQFRIFGYEPGEVEPTYDLFVNAVHPEDRERVLKAVENVLAGIEPYKIEFRLIRPDKNERIIVAQGEVIRDHEGNPLKMLGTVFDITEHKRSHERLRESRIRIDSLINNTDDLICSRDMDGALTTWNRAFAESIKTAFGVEPFVGMRTVDYLDPQQRENFNRHREAFKRVLSGERVREEFMYELPNGEENFYEISWSPIRLNNEVVGAAEITRNITDRKQYENKLQNSIDRFNGFLKNSSEAIWCIDLHQPISMSLPEDEQVDMIFEYAYFLESNDMYARMLGYETAEDVIGRYLREVMPRSIPENIETLKTFVRRRYNVVDLESSEITLQGAQRFFLNNVSGITKDGLLLRAWGVQRDITEQKRIRRELKNSKIDLQKLAGRLISNQEKELSRLARELHDDLTQKLAVMAIDVGNVIAQSKELPESVLSVFTDIRDGLIAISKTVHKMSRDLHPSILDDLGIERAIQSECSTFSSRTGIAVNFTPQNVPSDFPKDIALSVYRIIQEGLSNIAKHAETKNAYVFLEGSGHNIILTVRDAGIGFDQNTVRKRAGLGLGSIRERVRLVNGRLAITSSPGKGTSIEVKIPLKAKHE